MSETKIPPVHPGEVLLEEFLKPLSISPQAFAEATQVALPEIERLLTGDARMTAHLALRLARYLGTSAELWMNLQSLYDLEIARDESAEQIAEQIVPLAA